MAIDKVLKDLEAALKKSYPRRLATFAKPVKSTSRLAKATETAVPDDLAKLYAWHGGAPGLFVDENTGESSEGWDFSSPDGVIADWKIWSKLSPKGWKDTWLPIFSNGGGDNVCLDAASGKLVGMFHEEPEDHPVIFPSLEKAMAYVLGRVKKGTWCGVPETGELKRVLGKIEKKNPNWGDLFGNDIFRLMDRDPRAGLRAIDAAEKAGAPRSDVLKFRAEALLAAGDLDGAWTTFQAYLRNALDNGSTYNPPWRTMRDGFAEAKKKEWAFAASEIYEMDEAYLFTAWLEQKEKPRMKDVLDGLDETIEAAKGKERARAWAAKAQALSVLGKSAEAKKAWVDAAKADAKVTAFWRSFPD